MTTFTEAKPTEPGLYWIRPKVWIAGVSGYQVISVRKANEIHEFRHHYDSELAFTAPDWGKWKLLNWYDSLLFSEAQIERPADPEPTEPNDGENEDCLD